MLSHMLHVCIYGRKVIHTKADKMTIFIVISVVDFSIFKSDHVYEQFDLSLDYLFCHDCSIKTNTFTTLEYQQSWKSQLYQINLTAPDKKG